MKNDDWERMKNGLIFKMYLTDREMEEVTPALAGVFVVVVVILIGIAMFNSCLSS